MITSRQNAWVKRMQRALREHADEIVLEGPKQVDDAIRAGWKPIAVVGRDVMFSDALIQFVSDTKTSQGVIALFERPRFTMEDALARRDTIAVALDGVQDPGNVGTIVRLAAAFDASGVLLLPGCADAYSPKAIRASAGAALNVPIANADYEQLSKRTLFFADARGTSSFIPPRNAILVLGSEGSGVSEAIRRAGTPVAIPTSNRVESLNVAAAAAILLSRSFEARR